MEKYLLRLSQGKQHHLKLVVVSAIFTLHMQVMALWIGDEVLLPSTMRYMSLC